MDGVYFQGERATQQGRDPLPSGGLEKDVV